MFNSETVIHPSLQHLGITTGNMQPMLDWYKTVLGMRVVFQSDNPMGQTSAGSRPRAAWLSNDEVSHRLAIIEIVGLSPDPERSRHRRVQHFAFEYNTLDELLGTYVRLKELDILPVLPVDEGSQIAFYYADPDGNCVELNVNNYGDQWTAIEHIQNSPDFARRPLGVDIDPDKLVVARDAGATAWELHKRAWRGEFAPAKPHDPSAVM